MRTKAAAGASLAARAPPGCGKCCDRFHSGGGQKSDIALIGELSKNMLGRTFCALGDAAAMPTISIVEKFPEDFEAHLNGKPCPYQHSAELAMA